MDSLGIQEMAMAVNPKVLLPIHTEHADKYGKYFKNVKQIGDCLCLEL